MREQFYWLRWDSIYRNLFVALLIILLSSIVYLLVAYAVGEDYSIPWSHSGEWLQNTVIIDQFTLNQVPISQDRDVMFIIDRYNTLPYQTHTWIGSWHFIGMLTAFSFILTILTYTELWFYIMGMGLYMFFLVSGKSEVLSLFGIESRIPIIGFILLSVGVSYYFHAYGATVRLVNRLVTFIAIHILLGILFYFFSERESAWLLSSHYSMLPALIITILFILITAKDTIHFFVVLTSTGKTTISDSGNRAWNFLILGLLYFANLGLLWFVKSGIVDINIILLPTLFLFLFSVILGIWIQRLKEDVLGSAIPFQPLGGLLYLSLAIIATLTLATAYMSANDALISLIERVYIYAHLAIGVALFIYVLINFWMVYLQPIEVYKVFYKPARISLFSMTLIGFVGMIAIHFHSNFVSIALAKTGYYTHVGDAYWEEKDTAIAYQHYQEAVLHARISQKVNYVLAAYHSELEEKEKAFEYLQNLIYLHPTEKAYIAISNFYINNNQLFPAIFLLKDGLLDYPSSHRLYNNLGYLYHKMPDSDSSIYFYQQSIEKGNKDIAVSNLLAYQAADANFEACSAIIKKFTPNSISGLLANSLGYEAIAGVLPSYSLPEGIRTDSILDPYIFTILNNYTLSHLKSNDSTLADLLQQYIRQPENDVWGESLLISQLMFEFYSRQDIVHALTSLKNIAIQTEDDTYFDMLAYWQLRSGLYGEAINSYDQIRIKQQQWTYIPYLLAVAEIQSLQEHTELLTTLTTSLSPEIKNTATALMRSTRPIQSIGYDTLSEQSKAQYMYYYGRTLSPTVVLSYTQALKDLNLRLSLELALAQYFNSQGDYTNANIILSQLFIPETVDPGLIALSNREMVFNMIGLEQWEQLQSQAKGIKLSVDDKGILPYIEGKLKVVKGDTLGAGILYAKAIQSAGYEKRLVFDCLRRLTLNTSAFTTLDDYNRLSDIHFTSGQMGWELIQLYVQQGLYTGIENEVQRFSPYLTTQQIKQIQAQVNTLQGIN
ncbi:MAG: hypothetical protein MUE33_02390 [Cytophagaceae bacterium]|jgi:tetratricopeptide (TPR) repeat protein|nr:hypothetical protein [Cytophagaceae bacterium]